MDIAGFSRCLADFAVWDNDGLYALVTVVSIVFTVALIIMVMRKSREHDAETTSKTAVDSPLRARAAQIRAATTDQVALARQAAQAAAADAPTSSSTATPDGQ